MVNASRGIESLPRLAEAEIHRRENELKRKEARLLAALHVSRAGTYSWNLRTGAAEWDDALRHVFQLGEDETISSFDDFLQRVHPDDRADVVARCEAVKAQRTELSLEYRILTPGGIRWIHARGGAPDACSDVTIGACIDVTEQALARRELLNSQERLVAALAASHTGTFRWDIRTNQLEWDSELNRLFGLTGTATAGALPEFFALVHPDDLPRVASACERCRESGADFHEEFRIPLPDGSVRWLEDKGKTFFGPDGRPAYMTGACVDITARKEAEKSIQLNRERFELVREASGVGFWFCDLPFGKLDWDARVKAHFGLPPDAEVSIDTFFERLHPEDREPTRRAIDTSISLERSYDVEYRTVGLDGVTRWIRAIGATRLTPEGRPYRFDGITIDISENVRARELLKSRGEELERTVAERTASLRESVAELEKFSYSISHDLRAPLRAMQSFAQLLSEEFSGKLGEEGRDYVRRIVAGASRMDRLIHDVLVYSRVARTELPLGPVALQPLVDGIVESYPQFQPSVADVRVARDLPAVLGNEAALTQCISNLIGNAVKFVAPGVRPRVDVSAVKADGRVRLKVRDNGIGIPDDMHDKIFGIFERLSREYEGTGIGLAVVRKAAERMGGRVTVESQEGRGSEFCLELPAAP